MAKAGTPKKANPKPKLTDKEQSERFVKTARELGIDDKQSAKVFEDAFGRIAKPRAGPSRPNVKRASS
jgi:hypothetical protein